MMADLMTRLEDGLCHRGMRIHRPAGDEERRLQIKLVEQLQEFRRADTRLVATIAHGDEALRVQRVLAGPGGLRIHIEGEEHRRAIRFGPRIVRSRRRGVRGDERDARECLTVQH